MLNHMIINRHDSKYFKLWTQIIKIFHFQIKVQNGRSQTLFRESVKFSNFEKIMYHVELAMLETPTHSVGGDNDETILK